MPIIWQTIPPYSTVYIDGLASYDVVEASEFRHERINHPEAFVEERNYINDIENFWNQAKRHPAL
ncbi:MAG: transposase [Ferrovibrio sp.]|nr:transposase [Ferrovibrio sp.]